MTARPVINPRVGRGAIGTVLMAIAFLMLLLTSGTASAQVLYGSITGTVTDKTGAVVPNVSISITNQATGEVRTAKGNGVGEYSVLDVLPGTYTLSIARGGNFGGYSRSKKCRLQHINRRTRSRYRSIAG